MIAAVNCCSSTGEQAVIFGELFLIKGCFSQLNFSKVPEVRVEDKRVELVQFNRLSPGIWQDDSLEP
jgi:hypothetical protein